MSTFSDTTSVPDTIRYCSAFDTTIVSNVIGLNYQWQEKQNNISGFVNIADNTNFGGTNTTSLHLINIPSAWSGHVYRCLVNGNRKSRMKIIISTPVTPSITISGTTTIHDGDQVEVRTSILNGGANPKFIWQDSSDLYVWRTVNPTLPYISNIYVVPRKQGYKFRCFLISSDKCAIPDTVMSNTLVYTVLVDTTVTAINPVTGGGTLLRIYPNPASSYIYIDSLKLSDKWQFLNVISADGRVVMAGVDISNTTRRRLPIAGLPNGQYMVILTRRNGRQSILHYVKIE